MILERHAKPTLTAVELDRGDTLRFTRMDGRTVALTLRGTGARVLRTTLPVPKLQHPGALTELRFHADVEIDGIALRLERELCTPQSFYEPWEVAGLRLWFDAVDDLFEFMEETHGACRPRRHARFALQDATLRVCPPLLHPWCPLAEEGLDIRECYNGDDCWMGPYFGASAHGGLDINHPRGTPVWAPIDLDDQWLFNRVPEANNNRWRGVRTWPDGSAWTLQVHHVIRLTVPERTPLQAGRQFAEGAGVRVGSHDHSHFVFRVREGGDPAAAESHNGRDPDSADILLDPWILFWQMYQDRAAFPDCFYRRADTGLHQGHPSA